MVNPLGAALLALGLSLALPARGAPRPCTPAEGEAALDAAGRAHRSWAELHAQYAKFARGADCDDGAIAEGWSDGVVRLLANRWGELPTVSRLAEADPGFLTFVLRHIDESAAPDDLGTALVNAQTRCPQGHARLCGRIMEACQRALAVDRAPAAQDVLLTPEGVTRLLGTRAPGVAWRRPLQLDLDGDGRVDFAALGTSSSEALVGVVLATAPESPTIFRFKRDATQAGLCADPARTSLTAEAPGDDDDAPVSARGFANSRRWGARLDDDECDAFRFYFDGTTVRWWRR